MRNGLTPAMLRAAAEGRDITEGMSDAIELSEAKGQADLVNSTRLPKKTTPDRATIAAATGIAFGDDVDELFVEASLPDGWRKEASDHAMWSDLVDNKGRRRAAIFYKAAFYDCRANMRFEPFYSIDVNYDSGYEACTVAVRDANGATLKDFGKSKDWDGGQKLQQAAAAWLDENYPDNRNPLAYWD